MSIEYKRIYERVAAEIRQQIKHGIYEINDRLPSERDLAAKFDVSRPSVREAIIALEVDGMVEVRTGSGVYVVSVQPNNGISVDADMGMFELLEARRGIESEAAALAAVRGSAEDIEQLEALLKEMAQENERDVEASEDADRRFHLHIAKMTANSAIYTTLELLWEARRDSPQAQHFLKWVRKNGVRPRHDEHLNIVNAIKQRDANSAKQAMTKHLNRVIATILEATEIEASEQNRKKRDFLLPDAS